VIATLALTTLIPSTDRARRRISPLGVMAGAVVAVVGLVVLAQSDLPVFERFQRFESGDSYLENSAQHRSRLNAAVVNRFDEWMVIGVGLDENSMFAADLFDQTDTYVAGGVHNMYLKVLFEAGLPALIGLLIIQLATLRAGLQLIVNTRHTELYPIAVALTGALVGACVVALFGPILIHRFFWLPIALIWCLWSLRREELRRPPVAAPVRPAGPAPLAALPPAPQDARPNGRGSAGGPVTGSPPSWPGAPGRSLR
jgi:O-antigen ligase